MRRCPNRHRNRVAIGYAWEGGLGDSIPCVLWCSDCGSLGRKVLKGRITWYYPDMAKVTSRQKRYVRSLAASMLGSQGR